MGAVEKAPFQALFWGRSGVAEMASSTPGLPHAQLLCAAQVLSESQILDAKRIFCSPCVRATTACN
jgi:hypothetical protein